MSRLREVLRIAMVFIFPWPGRRERRAAVAAATEQKERSRDAADRAGKVEQQIRLMDTDHFAAMIARQIRGEE